MNAHDMTTQELQSVIGNLRTELTQLRKELEESQRRCRQTEDERDGFQKENERLRQELAGHKASHSNLVDMNIELVGDRDRYQRENEELRRDITEMFICETEHLLLRVGQTYRFKVDPKCKRCVEMDKESAMTTNEKGEK
jgi:chromosome segregation ATPase